MNWLVIYLGIHPKTYVHSRHKTCEEALNECAIQNENDGWSDKYKILSIYDES